MSNYRQKSAVGNNVSHSREEQSKFEVNLFNRKILLELSSKFRFVLLFLQQDSITINKIGLNAAIKQAAEKVT